MLSNTLLTLGADVVTNGGIIAVLITSIAGIVIAYINRKERKEEKKRADDPDVKKRLEEAEELKRQKHLRELLTKIETIVSDTAAGSTAKTLATTSSVHLNISAALKPLNEKLDSLVEYQKGLLQNQKNLEEKISEVLRLDQDMHKWHDKDDQLGVKIWYSPREEVKELAIAIRELNNTMANVVNQNVRLEAAIKLINAQHEDHRR